MSSSTDIGSMCVGSTQPDVYRTSPYELRDRSGDYVAIITEGPSSDRFRNKNLIAALKNVKLVM